jgi:hypothetical protein
MVIARVHTKSEGRSREETKRMVKAKTKRNGPEGKTKRDADNRRMEEQMEEQVEVQRE